MDDKNSFFKKQIGGESQSVEPVIGGESANNLLIGNPETEQLAGQDAGASDLERISENDKESTV